MSYYNTYNKYERFVLREEFTLVPLVIPHRRSYVEETVGNNALLLEILNPKLLCLHFERFQVSDSFIENGRSV